MTPKERKTSRLPLVLSTLATVTATAAAVHYMRRCNEFNENALLVPPQLLREVREDGATLVYWIDEDGKQCYRTSHDITLAKK